MGEYGCTARVGRARIGLLALGAAFPAVVFGQAATLQQTHFTPYVDAAFEHDTNFFALGSSVPAPLGDSGPAKAASFEKYRAGFDAAYDVSQQELFADFEGRRFQYQDFSTLDHTEYLLHGGLRWRLDDIVDGIVDYQRERSQVSYLLFNASPNALTQLYLQVQDIGTASVNLQITPEWRWENQGKINNLDSPRPGYPDLSVRENSIDEGFKYTGFANLSAGLVGEYLNGHFTSGEFLVSPRYHQFSGDLAADYSLSGQSQFHGEVGYSDRNQGGGGSVSGLTGVLAYQRDLTGKTSINVKVARAINVYVTAATPEIDTTAELDVVWNATSKIGVALGYQYQHSQIGATDIIGVVSPARTDNLQTPSLAVKYQALDWLSVRPYVQYQRRSSSFDLYAFNGAMYGLEVEARFGKQTPLSFARP